MNESEPAKENKDVGETRPLGEPPGEPESDRSNSEPADPKNQLQQLGRYKILKRLGHGGMGSVFLAQDEALDRRVALKIPQLSGKNDAEVIERFRREAQAAATLDHPNLCAVFDVGEEDGQHYLAMAFIDGRPLTEFIRSGSISQRKAAALIGKVALALDEAHQSGVIHRDLKPANIMINEKRQPVVVDFGLARRAESASSLTGEGVAIGTPAYMSPEQIRASTQKVGPQTDVYSLGVVLYELLTGQTPFRGDAYDVAAQIVHEAPAPPSTVRADTDAPLQAICLRAMEKNPENRFASMAEFAAAIKAYLADPDARFKGRSADVPEDELPQLAPLDSNAVETQVVLDTQLEKQLSKPGPEAFDERPSKTSLPPKDFSKNRETLTMALAIAAVVYGGYRCLQSLTGLLIGLISFSLVGLAATAWFLALGAVAALLAFLGVKVFQRKEGAARRASQVAIVLIGLVLIMLVVNIVSTAIVSQAVSATLENPEASEIEKATRHQLEQSRTASMFAGIIFLQLIEMVPLGFIIWAEHQLRQLPEEPEEHRVNPSNENHD